MGNLNIYLFFVTYENWTCSSTNIKTKAVVIVFLIIQLRLAILVFYNLTLILNRSTLANQNWAYSFSKKAKIDLYINF